MKHSLSHIRRLSVAAIWCVVLAGCRPAAETRTAADADASRGAPGKDDSTDAALPQVSVATARSGPIEKLLSVTGTLTALRDREATVGVPIAGIIDELPVHLGDTIAAGQIVAHLSTRPLLGQIQQARAGIAQGAIQVQQARVSALQQQSQTKSGVLQAESALSGARANLLGAQASLTGDEAALANAQQSLTRAKSLFADGLVAQKDVDAADLAVRSAGAQVEAQQQTVAAQRETVTSAEQALQAAQAARLQDAVKQADVEIAGQQRENARGALATAEAQLALYTIRAPIGGVVTSVNIGLGETVDTTTKIMTIANLDRLQLQIAVPAASAGTLRLGQPVTFNVDAFPGRAFRASIRLIGTQVDPTNNTITAIADVPNFDHALKDDMPARVGIVVARHAKAVLAPKSAVFLDTDGVSASVLKIDAANVAHKADVTVGLTEGDRIEILSGVKAGDKLATTGGYGLADGTKVTIASAGTTDK